MTRPVSLQRRLTLGLGAATLVLASTAMVLTWRAAWDEALDAQDDALAQLAQLVERTGATPRPLLLQEEPGAPGADQDDDGDDDETVVVRTLPATGGGPAGAMLADLRPDLPEGLQQVRSGGVSWRVLVRTLSGGRPRLVVGQLAALRDANARHAAWREVAPLLLLALALPLLARALVRSAFAPLGRRAQRLEGHAGLPDAPVMADDVPAEVRPFVQAIDSLLARVQDTVRQQRLFIADAAHELRSPLTAMALQVERLGQRPLDEDVQRIVQALQRGVHRTQAVAEQLLSLARLQNTVVPSHGPASLREVLRQVLEDLVPLAEARPVHLAVDGDADPDVAVDPAELSVLVRNLLDNAVRYTPPGGRVDVALSLRDRRAWLVVADTGPGIPEADRARACEPFARLQGGAGEGAGLGLSIVGAVAARHDLAFSLEWTDPARREGLRVVVSLPLAA